MLVESPCWDCCVHFFCLRCALCQEYRELKNRGFDVSVGKIMSQSKKYLKLNVYFDGLSMNIINGFLGYIYIHICLGWHGKAHLHNQEVAMAPAVEGAMKR
jgi:hypothetical protein